jgi:hypothetical protein
MTAIVKSRAPAATAVRSPRQGCSSTASETEERLVSADGSGWFRALHKIESGRIPPEEEEQPARGIVAGRAKGG